MYMPLMVDIKKAVVFAGERGEGLQKTQKLAVFADEMIVVPETAVEYDGIWVNPGQLTEVNEKLDVDSPRKVPVAPEAASLENVEKYIAGATFVTSDLADRTLNVAIRDACRKQGILCNIIDTKDLCDTWFMSLIKTPYLTVGLSSQGGCAYYAVRTREELQSEIERRAEVSHILTDFRASLDPKSDRYAALDKVYRDRKFQALIRKQKWEKARARAWELRPKKV